MSAEPDRELDIVLVGATGYVGRLTAEHLARYVPSGLRVGLAGRSADRLRDLAGRLPAAARRWPMITIDVTDTAAVDALARRTRVLVSTLGPYLRHGLIVVRACAAAGTHYADLTGEPLFVRRSIDDAHEPALVTGARIVHSCGFDSIPSDLGVGLTAARAADDGVGRLTAAVLHVRSLRGGLSGGSIDSLRQQVLAIAAEPRLRDLVDDQLALTSESSRKDPGRTRDRDGRGWQAPFVMGPFNSQIVQRSNELGGWAYGRDLGYREVVDTGTGPAGAVKAGMMTLGTVALVAGLGFGPTRRLLDRVLPDPGEGPSEQTRRNGRFVIDVLADTDAGARYRTRVAADHDPGYGATAIMLGESAFALAADSGLPDRSGVLTPMSAMGEVLAARLRERAFVLRTERLR